MIDPRSAKGALLSLLSIARFTARGLTLFKVLLPNRRTQATMMLRGGLLASLAGTATVCAFLSYLKRGEASAAPTDEIPRDTVGEAPAATTAAGTSDREERAEGSATRCSEGGGITKPLRLLYQRLVAKAPSTRNLVRNRQITPAPPHRNRVIVLYCTLPYHATPRGRPHSFHTPPLLRFRKWTEVFVKIVWRDVFIALCQIADIHLLSQIGVVSKGCIFPRVDEGSTRESLCLSRFRSISAPPTPQSCSPQTHPPTVLPCNFDFYSYAS